jgi:UDP-N-acetylmuramate dehydrogenase
MKRVPPFVIGELVSLFKEQVKVDVSLAAISQWKIGGRAAVLVEPRTKQQLIQIRKYLADNRCPYLIIGNTTNLLFTDNDIDAVVVRVGSNFSDISVDGNLIVAQSGTWVPNLSRRAMQAGLAGLEHICGIPGTLGGLVVMNGGSQRKGIGSVIKYVETVNSHARLQRYPAEECQFSYRKSIFQEIDEWITEVALELERASNKQFVHAEMLAILRSRSRKFPRRLPNCGSVFVSDPEMYEDYGPPGRVIEMCGLKGMVEGGAQVSPRHANFIVNSGGATAADVLCLIQKVRESVYREIGYKMKVEAKFVNELGMIEEI